MEAEHIDGAAAPVGVRRENRAPSAASELRDGGEIGGEFRDAIVGGRVVYGSA